MHLLTQHRPNSQKIQTLNMQLAEFQCGLLSLLQALVAELQTNYSQINANLPKALGHELQKSRDKLNRYRLHHILKRKISRSRRQSMICSGISSQQPAQLQKSLLLLEKDLGIDSQEDEITRRLALSSVVSRSFISEQSPQKLRGLSLISEVQTIPLSSSNVQFTKLDLQTIPKQNVDHNDLEVSNQAPQQQQPKSSKKITNTSKKPKKIVYSKTELSKDGLLGNLLEETYNSLDKNDGN